MLPSSERVSLISIMLCLSSYTILSLSHHHQVGALQSSLSSSSINKQHANQTTSSLNDTSGVDDILKDTIELLDSLNERLAIINNKTASGGAFRMLNDQKSRGRNLDDDELTSLAEGFSSERRLASSAYHGTGDPLALAASTTNSQQAGDSLQQTSTLKRTRQLSADDHVPLIGTSSGGGSLGARFDNDFTEKHIRFSLDLMQAIFASHSYTAKSNSIDSFLISPVSIQLVLMMMHLGARGQTKRELSNSLHLLTSSPVIMSGGSSSNNNNNDYNLQNENKLTQQQQQQHQASGGHHHSALNNQQDSGMLNSTATATAAAAAATQTNNGNKNAKLTRRHHHQQQQQQQPNSGAKPTAPLQSNNSRQQQQQQQPKHQNNNNVLHQVQQSQSNNVHEQFGNAMRQLLKDQTVVKALTSANQIFLQRDLPLAPQYEWAVKHYYGTDLKLVDFQNQDGRSSSKNHSSSASSAAAGGSSSKNNIQQMINDWVERQTRGKISQFLSAPVPTSTLLMALNVLFFKGDWQYKFDPADTDPDAWFTQTNGRTVKVPMMVNKLPLAYAYDPQMKTSVIELPYKAQRLGLFILLPDEVNGIFDTMQMLNSSSFANLISMMRKPSSFSSSSSSSNSVSDPHNLNSGINVRIPKFNIESSPRMSHILSQQLGLKTLFSPDQADLSGMFSPQQQQKRPLTTGGNSTSSSSSSSTSTDSSNATTAATNHPAHPFQVGLDELLHKAVLQVHEQGSVAAAASATIVERVGLFNGQYFEADHPFLLFLMDKQTGLVLFSGVFAGPAGSGGQDNTNTASHSLSNSTSIDGANATTLDNNHHQAAGRSPKIATTGQSS